MTDADPPIEQSTDQIRLEAQRLLNEVKQIKEKAEEQLRETEASRKKADDDASYAFRAKTSTEEHAKATAAFKGQAEADINSISTNKKNADESFAAVTRIKVDIDADSKIVGESRQNIELTSQEINKASQAGVAYLQSIEATNNSSESILKAITEARDTAISASKSSETAKCEIDQLSSDAKKCLANIEENSNSSSGLSQQIEKLLLDAQNNQADLVKILEHLTKSDGISTEYETRLNGLSQELGSLIQKAEGLLPGFTSAGLASAFCAQKSRFAAPQKRWYWIFIICIGLLVAVSLPSFLIAVFGSVADSLWHQTFHGFVMRLPILIPLIWLAIYAGRNYMLALRLEEDYAYKEAISTAFEGYKREMEQIASGDPNTPAPIHNLCVNVLSALAERPGRIYDHRNKDITIANEAVDAVVKAKELGQKQIGMK
jgi:hypothetical protein